MISMLVRLSRYKGTDVEAIKKWMYKNVLQISVGKRGLGTFPKLRIAPVKFDGES